MCCVRKSINNNILFFLHTTIIKKLKIVYIMFNIEF